MSEAHFSNLSKLTVLDLTDNSLALKFESNWAPTFQLFGIFLSSCNLGPHFPQWLRNQNNFVSLDISGSGISDTIPNWFWNLSNSRCSEEENIRKPIDVFRTDIPKRLES
jgi:hypothetical protein